MSYYVRAVLARVPAGPTHPKPTWADPDPASSVIISCKAKQLGVFALLRLPSPFLFLVLGKKRLIKLRKYPFSPSS